MVCSNTARARQRLLRDLGQTAQVKTIKDRIGFASIRRFAHPPRSRSPPFGRFKVYHRVRIILTDASASSLVSPPCVMHISPSRISYSFHILRPSLSRSIRAYQSFYLHGPCAAGNTVSIMRRGECYAPNRIANVRGKFPVKLHQHVPKMDRIKTRREEKKTVVKQKRTSRRVGPLSSARNS